MRAGWPHTNAYCAGCGCLGEALKLSWHDSDSFMVDLDGKFPMFRLPEDADKSRKNRLLPMVPEFAEYLQQIMRHSAISTTMSFCVQAGADATAATVWAAHGTTTISLTLFDAQPSAHEKTPEKSGV